MTMPSPHGYPDWGRYVAQADKQLLDTGVVADSGTTTYNLGFVGDVGAIGFWFRANTQGHGFFLDFYTDATYTVRLNGYIYSLATGIRAWRTLATLGPYLQLRVVANAAGGSHEAAVWTSSRPAISTLNSSVDNLLIQSTAVNVAGAGNHTLNSTLAWPGEAYWTVTSSATTWRCLLQHVDLAGAANTFDSMEGVAGQTLHHKVFLPPRSIRTVYTNTGAGAANYDTYVGGRPLEPGS
jgi:hypothetical protein